jgi:hypothetical protein
MDNDPNAYPVIDSNGSTTDVDFSADIILDYDEHGNDIGYHYTTKSGHVHYHIYNSQPAAAGGTAGGLHAGGRDLETAGKENEDCV